MNEWFASLSQSDRKKLVCILFEVRRAKDSDMLKISENKALFDEFVGQVDKAHHSLK